ncbi:MAG: (d)CMP kinase [Methylococcaceae bacterium]
MNIPVITVDGPSGSGKGTICRKLATKLGWHYLDSGSIYRALAISVLDDHGTNIDQTAAVVKLAQGMRLRYKCDTELKVFLNEVDVTYRLADEKTGNMASKVAVLQDVRAVLLQKQRDFKQMPGLVADGRDMGTVVFPEADYKVFLTAQADVRAERRYKQLKEKGIDANLLEIREQLQLRDQRDQARAIAPLKAAEDCLSIDSSTLAVNAVLDQIIEFINST